MTSYAQAKSYSCGAAVEPVVGDVEAHVARSVAHIHLIAALLGEAHNDPNTGSSLRHAVESRAWLSGRITPEMRQRPDQNGEGAYSVPASADDIDNFYNPARRHSAFRYLTPNEFEDLRSTHIHTALS